MFHLRPQTPPSISPPHKMRESMFASDKIDRPVSLAEHEEIERGRLYAGDPEEQLEQLRAHIQELEYENEQLAVRCHGLLSVGQQMENDNETLQATVSRLTTQLENSEMEKFHLKAVVTQLKDEVEASKADKSPIEASTMRSEDSYWAKSWPPSGQNMEEVGLSLDEKTNRQIRAEKAKLERQFRLSQATLVRRQQKTLYELKVSRKRWLARAIKLAAYIEKRKTKMEELFGYQLRNKSFHHRWASSENLKSELESLATKRRNYYHQASNNGRMHLDKDNKSLSNSENDKSNKVRRAISLSVLPRFKSFRNRKGSVRELHRQKNTALSSKDGKVTGGNLLRQQTRDGKPILTTPSEKRNGNAFLRPPDRKTLKWSAKDSETYSRSRSFDFGDENQFFDTKIPFAQEASMTGTVRHSRSRSVDIDNQMQILEAKVARARLQIQYAIEEISSSRLLRKSNYRECINNLAITYTLNYTKQCI